MRSKSGWRWPRNEKHTGLPGRATKVAPETFVPSASKPSREQEVEEMSCNRAPLLRQVISTPLPPSVRRKFGKEWRPTGGGHLLVATKILFLILIAHELYLNIPCQRCLPQTRITACAALEQAPQNASLASTETRQIAIRPDANNSSTSPASTMIGSNATDNGTTMKSMANNRPLEKHQQPHNVLCNSRCKCVILDPVATAASNQIKVGNSSLPSDAAHPQAPAEKTSPQPVVDGESINNKQQHQHSRVEQALVAFSEDYSLDYDSASTTAELAESGSGAATTSNEQPIGGADLTATNRTSNVATDPRGTDHRSPVADRSSAPPTTLSGDAGYSGGRPYANSTGLLSAGADASMSGGGASNNASAVAADEIRQKAAGENADARSASVTLNTSVSQQQEQPRTNSTVQLQSKQPKEQAKQQQQPQQSGAKRPTAAVNPQAAATAPSMTLFPLHHLHHHLHNGAAGSGGRDSSGPQLYAQSLYSSQAPKLSYHAHAPYLKLSSAATGGAQQQQLEPASFPTSGHAEPVDSASRQIGAPSGVGAHHRMRTSHVSGHHLRPGQVYSGGAFGGKLAIARLVPLKTMHMEAKLRVPAGAVQTNASEQASVGWFESRQVAELIAKMLKDIGDESIQSLSLHDNELQFELWSELYALLAADLRQNLYQLDLSHNSLAKLGVTFTGYIEHHLAAHGNWPFSGLTAPDAATGQSLVDHEQRHSDKQAGSFGRTKSTGPKGETAGRSSRHPTLLNGGKLYSLVRRILDEPNALVSPRNASTALQKDMTAILQRPMQLRALDLSHNKLKWLINDQFRALKHVQTIRLDYNRIRYIHQHAFSGLESLRYLNLNFNRLQVIYIEQFQTNFNLLSIMLRANYLAYLRGGSFASQANLRRLDLSQNKLTIISNNAFVGLESLEVLNCSSNQFVHAPTASLHPLTNLRHLDLSENLIAQLAPGTFFRLPVEELRLDQNEQLVSIDRGAFWDLPYLRRLNLSSSPALIGIHPQAFVGCQSLSSIHIDECPSLDTSARQLIENVTMLAASRSLQQEHSQLIKLTSDLVPQTDNRTTTTSNDTTKARTAEIRNREVFPPKHLAASTSSSTSIGGSISDGSMRQSQSVNKTLLLRYFYCLGIIASLVVAVKLVFKYTSTSHFMEARRRRRRVYGESKRSDSDFGEDGSSMSSAAESYQMCEQVGGEFLRQPSVIRGSEQLYQAPGTNYDAPADCGYARRNSQQVDSNDEGVASRDMQKEEEERGQEEGGGSNTVLAEDSSVTLSGDQVVPIAGEECNVISSSGLAPQMTGTCCLDCPGGTQDSGKSSQSESESQAAVAEQLQQHQQANVALADQASTIDLIHSQLVAAGFDYGHANCAHFYQSLGPALQLADMTANFVNGMDYY